MDRKTRAKEATQTALALVLVYGIALKSGWMDPYWAGFAVAMVSLAAAGESLHKGILRLAGTIPGCIAALSIYALAPQSRWVFMLLLCAWIFTTTYMMLADKNRSYMWNVAGFVCLVITLTGPDSSEKLFEHAVYRTTETAMGVVIYTLVTVFLWPFSDAETIEKASQPQATARTKNPGTRLPVPDLDYLMGAIFAATVVGAGFLVWIFFNPPGHGSWFLLSGTIAMAVAANQQFKATMLIKPMALALALGLAAYVFIMPQLSTFAGLSVLIFLAMFIVCYFFTGIARLAGMIAILTQISVQNQQSYDFAAMANSYIFTLMSFIFVFGISFMLRSPRPEKAVLHLLGRFFNSAGFMVSRLALESGQKHSFVQRWRTDFYRHEMQTLPAKLEAWGKAIDLRKFPNNTPGQTQELVKSLQTLVDRIEQLLDARSECQEASLVRDLRDYFEVWGLGIQRVFATWSGRPEAQAKGDQEQDLKPWLAGLEKQIREAEAKLASGDLSEQEGESFYRLLGGYRDVSDAALAYTGVAGRIDWPQWREEKF